MCYNNRGTRVSLATTSMLLPVYGKNILRNYWLASTQNNVSYNLQWFVHLSFNECI